MIEPDYLIALGKNIAKKRREAGIIQAQLALRCEMERQNLSRIETGKTNPTILTLRLISVELGLRVSDLLDFEQK